MHLWLSRVLGKLTLLLNDYAMHALRVRITHPLRIIGIRSCRLGVRYITYYVPPAQSAPVL